MPPRRSAVEARVYRLVEQVLAGANVEDDHVELKAEWPEPDDVVRRIAGHANAAHGEPILWVIGINERAREVVTPQPREVSAWWDQVRSRFDLEVAPDLSVFVVDTDQGASLVALHMETDAAPYVVKLRPTMPRTEREVPWRQGNRTRSATRQEMLLMLASPVRLPPASVYSASVVERGGYSAEAKYVVHVQLGLMIGPPSPGQTLMFIEGDGKAEISIDGESVATMPLHMPPIGTASEPSMGLVRSGTGVAHLNAAAGRTFSGSGVVTDEAHAAFMSASEVRLTIAWPETTTAKTLVASAMVPLTKRDEEQPEARFTLSRG